MNLIQVQEHLKDMPMRAIMEYANGKNPQVPPYLALGELNRRKQMEQSARTGTPPEGTALAFAMDRSSYPDWIVDTKDPVKNPLDDFEEGED